MPRPEPTRDVDAHLPLTPVAFEILLTLADGEQHGYGIMLAVERRTGGAIALHPAPSTARSPGSSAPASSRSSTSGRTRRSTTRGGATTG